MSSPGPLEVRHRARARLVAAVLGGIIAVAMVSWHMNHPAELPTQEGPIRASTTAGTPVYVGAFVPPADFERDLSLSGVKVHTTANTEVSVVPLLCRGGGFAVTTAPEPFCDELVDPEGERFEVGDSIVLEVSSEDSAIAVIDRVRLGFREGLQWGTEAAGVPAIVLIQETAAAS